MMISQVRHCRAHQRRAADALMVCEFYFLLQLNFIKNKKLIGHFYVKFHALQLLFGTFFNISYCSQFGPASLKINSIKKKSGKSFLRKNSHSSSFVWNFSRYLLRRSLIISESPHLVAYLALLSSPVPTLNCLK